MKTAPKNKVDIVCKSNELVVPNIASETRLRVKAKRPVPKHATITWEIEKGAQLASFSSSVTSTQVCLQARSAGTVIVSVEVCYDDCAFKAQTEINITSPAAVRVEETAFKEFSGRRFGYEKTLHYQLLDHVGKPLNYAGILMTEELVFKNLVGETKDDFTLKMRDGSFRKFLKSNFFTGQQSTNFGGMFSDHLRLNSASSLPKNTKVTIEQTLRANGIVVCKNTLHYTHKNVEIINHKHQNGRVNVPQNASKNTDLQNTLLAS